MKKLLRHRSALIYLAPLLVLALLWLHDPDGGASTRIWALRLSTALVTVALSHWVRKAYFDYPESDLRSLFAKAREEPTGAGLALVAVSIFLFGVLMLFGGQAHGQAQAQDVRNYIPPQAKRLMPLLKQERMAHWPDHPAPQTLPALIEHESCVSLKHARCWSPTSRLKSAREEGAGLGQITRAWRPDGSLRFDALAHLRESHPALEMWSWDNVYQRAELQLRAVVLMSRDNYQGLRMVRDPWQRLAMADAAYNGGLGGLQSERRACALVPGCDPQQWWGHVETRCLKSRAALYGGRSACDINRHHVHDVLRVRSEKYKGLA